MSQKDRYRDRILELDFEVNECFEQLPYADRFSLVLVTDGTATALLNNKAVEIAAPCVLCLSGGDSLTVNCSEHIAAQTLSFSTDFFGVSEKNENIPTGLSVFHRNEINTGLFFLDKTIYGKLWDWFFILGMEVFAQSDCLWVCRIKKYLLQIMGMLADLCCEQERDPVNLALNYIHSSYFKKITLDELCRQAHINRVSLNKLFRDRYDCTAMEYLNIYRLKMAEKILTYTRMNLNDISHAVGFEYDTYFIRQFTRWKGMSPTAFRKTSQQGILRETELIL